jgi:hypothetical protein
VPDGEVVDGEVLDVDVSSELGNVAGVELGVDDEREHAPANAKLRLQETMASAVRLRCMFIRIPRSSG